MQYLYSQTFNGNIFVSRIMFEVKLPFTVMVLHFDPLVSHFALLTPAGK